MRVLLVEDDASCVRMIQSALKGLTQKIDVTDKLADAFSILCDDYDALWLDLSLTDSTSMETLEAIPSIRSKCPNITLLVVSGYGEKFREKALENGADAYASKLDLDGFRSSAIAKLFTQAATHAMERGVDASFILQRVSSFLHTSLTP